ncbi:hypothetical protein K2173_002529 [Erythroxylum novogranatense]|uniref:J domain-containing protein n=1 Tax=Erythroxylum novogranatense TaxID=1862640 RepID=A0AAV8TSU5_9ROSI|nr:hypothetical protein K2173_002529 [Erythroxylum novogranatense]
MNRYSFFSSRGIRCFSTGAESIRSDFPSENAYDILGVPETCSFAEIKASFRKLAKETHPDLDHSNVHSQRFIRILAAYEILSDSERRAHYDSYLLAQRMVLEKHSRPVSTLYMYKSYTTASKEMEVVEWLRWYRSAINDIVLEKKVAVGTGYFNVLEADFYSAVRAAYYGPGIESMDLLPDCFEAEERSAYDTPEVLHLVSGRDLFGLVCLADYNPQIAPAGTQKLSSFDDDGLGISPSSENVSILRSSTVADDAENVKILARNTMHNKSYAFKNLELHVAGRLVAVATRTPPKSLCDDMQGKDAQDEIHVFLSSDSNVPNSNGGFSKNSISAGAAGSKIQLGTVRGLGTSPEEGSCFVYDNTGIKTHVIMKHRTFMVRHMHWYGLGHKVSLCECRCTRARLPPSKFWLFEPRCSMHDIGGWYIETFGKDRKGHTVLSQRHWDGFSETDQNENLSADK